MGAQVGRSADYLSMAQFDLLSWVTGDCKGGTYQETSYRVSARVLHDCGLTCVEDRGPAWTAKITAEGTRLLKEQARRIEAERERERREEEARAEREREAQRLRARALEVLGAVTAAGGRLALTADYSEREITQITDCPARGSLIPRAARYLQGLVNAVAEMGWSAPAKVQAGYAGRGEPGPDLPIKLPSREFQVAIRELDERGRPGRAFTIQTDYLTRTERTTVKTS